VAKLSPTPHHLHHAFIIGRIAADRELVRKMVEPGRFIRSLVNAPIEQSASTDPKGLYAKARRTSSRRFITGVSAPYEASRKAGAFELRTDKLTSSNQVSPNPLGIYF